MYDIETIIAMEQKAARKAKRHGLKPVVLRSDVHTANTIEQLHEIPFTGSYVPKGWKLIKSYMVDSSGFGSDYEPALTIDAFLKSIKIGVGYAIIKVAQFQIVMGEFEPA